MEYPDTLPGASLILQPGATLSGGDGAGIPVAVQPTSTATEVKTVIAAEKIVDTVPPALLRIGINGILSALLGGLRFADEKGWIAAKTWTEAIDTQALVEMSSALSNLVLGVLIAWEGFAAWRKSRAAASTIKNP